MPSCSRSSRVNPRSLPRRDARRCPGAIFPRHRLIVILNGGKANARHFARQRLILLDRPASSLAADSKGHSGMDGELRCLITPNETVVALIDHQPQMFFG